MPFLKSFLWKGGSSGREQYGVDDNRASREKCAKERERDINELIMVPTSLETNKTGIEK